MRTLCRKTIKKGTPNSPMNGGQGVEVSKTLFYAFMAIALWWTIKKIFSSVENIFAYGFTFTHHNISVNNSSLPDCIMQSVFFALFKTHFLKISTKKFAVFIWQLSKSGGVGTERGSHKKSPAFAAAKAFWWYVKNFLKKILICCYYLQSVWWNDK